ncbi:MAG TPA: hypothetical protein VNE21_03775 [Mycobacteriales bacterium]|nr:hypothetical protein [Mycobacteriales bacterium]
MRRFVAPVTLAVALTATTLGVAFARHHGAPPTPPVLHLATGSAVPGLAAAGPGITSTGGGGGYVLAGALPDGPAQGRVRRFAPAGVTAVTVSRLAGALGLVAAPQRVAEGWLVTGDGARLVVSDAEGEPWAFGRAPCLPALPQAAGAFAGCAVASAGVSVTAAVAGGVGSAAPAVPAPSTDWQPVRPRSASAVPANPAAQSAPGVSAAQAEELARPVLEALGLAGVPARVDGDQVVVAPPVDGLPSSGFDTSLDIQPGGHVLAAARGWLGVTRSGAQYPLITARAAFRRLPPRVEPLIACLGGPIRVGVPSGASGCPGSRPLRITGVRFGLLLTLDGLTPTFVPAWLFTADGDASALPVIAVSPADVAPPVLLRGSSVRPVPAPGVPMGSPGAPAAP